jgi:aromatic ring-cleaving dioxygenase
MRSLLNPVIRRLGGMRAERTITTTATTTTTTIPIMKPQMTATPYLLQVKYKQQDEIYAKTLYNQITSHLREIVDETSLTKSNQEAEEEEQLFQLNIKPDGLGLLLQFLMVNRPQYVKAFIDLKDNNYPMIQFGTDEINLDGYEPVQGYPHPVVEPSERIRVFHIHCHFDIESEPVALQIHKALIEHVGQETGTLVKHYRVWREKNGPHDKWSWEIHVHDPIALSVAVRFLAANHNGFYYPFHCRTFDGDNVKNEFDDHAYRFGWIGSPDPDPLDIQFFVHW